VDKSGIFEGDSMTIRSDIKDTLRGGPLSAEALAATTGHPVGSIANACNYLHAEGAIRKVKGGFALSLVKAAPPMISRLTTPAWVPPKPLHRPTFHAPGCVVREKLTGRVLA